MKEELGTAKEDTAQKIALVLLWTFVVSFVALLLINVALTFFPPNSSGTVPDNDPSKGWLDMLRNATILLGTALTTMIGYYFGQRESVIARKEAKNAEMRAQASEEEADEKVKNLKEEVAEIAAAMPSGMPDDFAAARASLRKKPKG